MMSERMRDDMSDRLARTGIKSTVIDVWLSLNAISDGNMEQTCLFRIAQLLAPDSQVAGLAYPDP
jgi:hypothetical protein